MTVERASGTVPEWTLGDRLRKARQIAGLTVRDFAGQIGVSSKTVTDAEGDRRRPRRILVNTWAMRTGVSREWLETGQAPTGDGEGPWYTTRDLNPEPADSPLAVVVALRRVA